MPKITSIVAAVFVGLISTVSAAADNTTPIVADDVGHWLNLEYRSGTLAPEIADNPRLVQTLLVVERSLPKIDALLAQRDRGSPCLDLALPYFRRSRDIVTTHTADGGVTESVRQTRQLETLGVRVCTGVDQRSVVWVFDGALFIVARNRTDSGDFPRTSYSVFEVTADELERTMRRNARLADRGKAVRPPQLIVLYRPPGTEEPVRAQHPLLAFFGAEFSEIPAMARLHAETQSRAGASVKHRTSQR
jgi:hypothetical protein